MPSLSAGACRDGAAAMSPAVPTARLRTVAQGAQRSRRTRCSSPAWRGWSPLSLLALTGDSRRSRSTSGATWWEEPSSGAGSVASFPGVMRRPVLASHRLSFAPPPDVRVAPERRLRSLCHPLRRAPSLRHPPALISEAPKRDPGGNSPLSRGGAGKQLRGDAGVNHLHLMLSSPSSHQCGASRYRPSRSPPAGREWA